ncbi:MAG: hypothetical protein C4589_08335, partial [Peptococcaceae bacterium]
SPDILTGRITDPQSLNPYIYCEGNPVIYVDPTGYKNFQVQQAKRLFENMSYADLYAKYITLEGQIQNEAAILNGEYAWYHKNTASGKLSLYEGQLKVVNELLIIAGGYTEGEKEYARLTLDELIAEEENYDFELAFNAVAGGGGTRIVGGTGKAAGLVGKDFENFLVKQLGGKGRFKAGGREFDGAIDNRWYEAKSGKYWEMVASSKQKLNKFKSDMGQRLRIARENNATYELHSNTAIPPSVTAWLDKMGIKYTEWQ